MTPGQHVIVIGTESDALQARTLGLQLRDTLLILLPGPKTAFAFLFRQPLEGTVAENVLRYGVGGLNIDGCRIRTTENLNGGAYASGGRAAPMPGDERKGASLGMYEPGRKAHAGYEQPSGRWPSNLLLVHGPGCQRLGEKSVEGDRRGNQRTQNAQGSFFQQDGRPTPRGWGGGTTGSSSGPTDGFEAVPNWICQPDCPVKLLDEQSGDRRSAGDYPTTYSNGGGYTHGDIGHGFQGPLYADSGGASRFYPQFESLPEALGWLSKLVTPC